MSSVAYAMRKTPFWGGIRIWQRNRDAFQRGWRVEIGGIAVEPLVMLLAIGFGLGQFVEDIDGLRYAEFVAPGIIASQAMFHATFDSTFGAYLRMETHNIYEAVLFTPLGPADIVVGEVIWSASRGAVSGAAVLTMASIFGLVSSPLAILTIPRAYLIGLTISSIGMIMTSTATTIGAMNNFFTLFVLPMFWLSGVFFPLDRLPGGLQIAAWAFPLTPASALVRGLVTGEPSGWMLLWALQMAAYSLVALYAASILMRRRLIK